MATDVGSIVARLVLDRSPFTRGLEEAKAEARAFGDVVVPVAADTARFDAASAEVFAAKRVMASPVDTTVAADTGPFDVGAAQVEAMKARLAKPVDIPVEIDASKLGLFKRLVGGGESPGDVAKYLGFSRAELGQALATIARQAVEDSAAQFRADGEYAAGQMIAGWMAAAQRELGPGSAVETGFYRLLSGGADPFMSTGGPIPSGPSDPGWRFYRDPLALGPGSKYRTGWGQAAPPPAPPWIPPELLRAPEPLQLLASNPESATYKAYQKMYQAWGGTAGDHVWTEGPIPAGTAGEQGPGWGASILAGLTAAFGRLGARNDKGGVGALAPLAAAGGAAGLLGGLLWGGGAGGVPLLGGLGAGLAGFGSLGSLAGLGPEHVLMTLLGLGGSAVGAGLGGALLGAGSLGVMGVGMGTDMAGIGQAAGDIKSAYSIISNSALTAAQRQQQLNQALQNLTPAARSAVMSAANTAVQFHQMFDRLTGPAETIGAQIIQQAMHVGMAFLPTIGKYAAENMGIIRTSLQPLFGWLQGPGLAIFKQLEAKFQSDLPTAMHAFVQGVELVMRTLGLIAPKTGGLIKWIDQLVSKFNGAGWGQWSGEVNKLIGDFRQWEALIKIVVADIYQLFHHDAGTASSIVGALTQMLTKLHAYETSVKGGAAIHNMFEAHKQEVLQLLKLLPPLLSTLGHIELTLAPGLTRAFVVVLSAISPLLNAMAKNPFGAWVLGLTLIGAKLGVLAPVLRTFDAALGAMFFGEGKTFAAGIVGSLKTLAGLAWGAIAGGVRAVAAAFMSMDMSMVALSAVGIVAVAVGVYELIHHFGVLPGLMIAGAAAVGVLTVAMWALDAVPIVALIVGIGLAVAGLIAGIVLLATHWSAVWHGIESVASAAWNFLKSGWGWLLAGFMPPIGALVALVAHWQEIWSTIKSVASGAWNWITSTATATWHGMAGTAQAAWNGLESAWRAMWSAVQSVISTARGVVEAVMHAIGSALSAVLGPLNSLGGVWRAVWGGMSAVVSGVAGAIEGAIGGIVSAVHGAESAISALSSAYSAVTGKGPSIGGVSLNPLHYLPHLASGGLVTHPTVALVGEAGPELVIPMSMLNGPKPSPLSGMTFRGSTAAPAAVAPDVENLVALQRAMLAEQERLRVQLSRLLEQVGASTEEAAAASARTADALTDLPSQVALLKRTGAL